MRATKRLLNGALTAFTLLVLAQPGFARADAASQQDDPERIATLATQLIHGEYEQQVAARETLSADFGPYAVNGLLRYIGTSSDVEERVGAIYALRRLGTEATFSLIAAFHSGDATLRRNLCQVLGASGDLRAVATLTCAVEHDEDPLVRAEAAAAAMRLGSSPGDGVKRLLDLAHAFMAKSSEVILADESHERVFFWTGRKVGSATVSEEVYPYAYARLFAEDALRAMPDSADALATLVAAYDGMREAMGDDEGAAELAARIDDLRLLGGSGPALDDVPAFDASAIEGAGGSISSGDKRLRYLAALKSGGSSADVVEVLGHALSENAIRQVLVVDNNVESLNAVVGMLRTRDTYAIGASTAAMGLIRAKEAPVKDAILLRTTLSDIPVAQIISSLGRDFRTQDVPVIVIANEREVEALQVELGDKVVAVVPAPVNAAVLTPVLASAFDRMALNDARMDAVTLSQHAANALAALDGSVLAPATAGIVSAVGRDDAVQIPALRALAKLGSNDGQRPALGVFTNEAASVEARVAAAIALGGILARNAALPETLAALEKALQGEDAALRTAAARALGQARGLDTKARGGLLMEHRLTY